MASVLRGNQLARTHPEAPVYVCLDAAVQEEPFDGDPVVDASRYAPVADAAPSEDSLAAAARLLAGARRPVLLAGRVSRDPAEWDRRVELAERLGAAVVTDLKVGAAFPTGHPLHSGTPGLFVSPDNLDLLRCADVVLSLDWVDLGGTLRQAWDGAEPSAAVISASADHTLFNGWTKNDHFLHAMDVSLHCRPDMAVAALLARLPRCGGGSTAGAAQPPAAAEPVAAGTPASGPSAPVESPLTVTQLATQLREAVSEQPATLIRVPLSWDGSSWDVSDPLDYLGSDGGGGIGSGPGMAVGAALALQGSGRLPVAVLGDGDYLMGLTALWTAARYEVPLLVVVANNSSFFNDELHQDRVARARDRPVANAHIGMRVQGPDPDLAQLARGQGLEGIGPVTASEELACALQRAVRLVRDGHPTVVDVRVARGYGMSTAAAITRQPG